MLAARGAGLDTCAQASFIDFYPVLRENLRIPDDQLIICGLALAHADHTHRLNQHRTSREPVKNFTTFHEADGLARDRHPPSTVEDQPRSDARSAQVRKTS